MSDPTRDTYLSIADVAAQLNLSRRQVERLIAAGELPALRYGRTIRVRQLDATALAERAATAGIPGRRELDRRTARSS